MRAAVIVSTFDAPRELDLVLSGLARQVQVPAQVLVADDGSGPETRAVIDAWRPQFPCGLEHLWQADQGFRKMRACNQAARQARAERLIFLDGDSIPHRHFVADHLAAHRRADVLCGRRVKLGPALTARVDREWVDHGRLERWLGPTLWSALAGDTRRYGLGLRLPSALTRIFHPRPRKLMGVNFSIRADVFGEINGYNHDAPARREDRELELRLQRAGRTFAPLLNRAIVYHLHHPEHPPAADAEQRLMDLIRQGGVRSANGLDGLSVAPSEHPPAANADGRESTAPPIRVGPQERAAPVR